MNSSRADKALSGWIIGFFIRVTNLYKKFSDQHQVWVVLKPREEGTPVLEVQDLVPRRHQDLEEQRLGFLS